MGPDPMEVVWQNRQDCTSHCSDCPGCDSPYPLGGIGSTDADVMLVAQEPAYNLDDVHVDMDMSWEEARTKLLLERKASENPLWKHMENVSLAAGQVPSQLYFTNIAKCDDGDSSFTDRADRCVNYLPHEIAAVDPQVLLLHGGKVLDVAGDMLGIDFGSSVGAVHGELFSMNTFEVLPLYHWGYAYRQGNVSEYNSLVARRVAEVVE